jgi:AcrR family transcriptional regulator
MPTRSLLLDAAEEQMLTRSFEASSVDGSCTATDVTKGSFFDDFKGKEEVGKVLLGRCGNHPQEQFMDACAEIASRSNASTRSSEKKLRRLGAPI